MKKPYEKTMVEVQVRIKLRGDTKTTIIGIICIEKSRRFSDSINIKTHKFINISSCSILHPEMDTVKSDFVMFNLDDISSIEPIRS